MDVEGGNTFEETVKHTEIDHRSMEANPFDPPDPPRVSNILNTNTLLPSAVSDAISAMAHNFYGVQGAAAAIGGSPGPGWPQAIASFGHSRQNPGLPSAIEGILEVDEVIENTSVSGSFNFNLPDSSIQGTFSEVPWCINMK